MEQRRLGPRRPDVGYVDDDVGNVVPHDVEDGLDGMHVDVEVTVDDARGGKEAQLVGALGQQAIEERRIDALGRRQGFGNAHAGFLVEVQAGGAEGEVEIGDDRIGGIGARDEPADIVSDGARPDATLGADEGNDAADRLGLGVGIEIGHGLDDVHHVDAARRSIR